MNTIEPERGMSEPMACPIGINPTFTPTRKRAIPSVTIRLPKINTNAFDMEKSGMKRMWIIKMTNIIGVMALEISINWDLKSDNI